jgi:hypothetical protein
VQQRLGRPQGDAVAVLAGVADALPDQRDTEAVA